MPEPKSSEHTSVLPLLDEAGFTVVRAPRSLLERLGHLQPANRPTGTALHRPLFLLWAIGQVMAGADRLQRWSRIRDELVPVFEKRLGAERGAEAVRDPFWALSHSGLWEVTAASDLTQTSAGRRPTLESLNRVDPYGGLTAADYELFSSQPQVAAEAAANLLLRFFTPLPTELLADVGMTSTLAGRWADALRPIAGERIGNRTTISSAYGGNGVAGITRTADGILSVFSDETGPYDDSRNLETGWISYAGDGLSGDQTLTRGNKLLQEHREHQRPLRFWHKPFGQDFSFETWVVVVDGRLRWGIGADKQPRREYCWLLAPVPSPVPESWLPEVRSLLKDDTYELLDETSDYKPSDLGPNASGSIESASEIYKRLVEAAARRAAERASRKQRATIDRHLRSPSARSAVIQRSRGRCENLLCDGHPTELTTAGQPILQVDHVVELAEGGVDLPINMIALCPNCHALKTYGVNRNSLRRQLKNRAKELHEAALALV